jgi:sugar lactone lactonase YvrE
MDAMIALDAVETLGSGLHRPECVLATRRGDIFTADWRGGVAHLLPDGSQRLYAGTTADLPEGARPNGICLEADGSFLFANLGSEQGGIWRLTRRGDISPYLLAADGVDLPPSNFVTRDAAGRLWVTVSTRLRPRSLDYRSTAQTGFVICADERGARLVADGLGFANECLVDPTGGWLYVNETYVKRLSRYPLLASGDLGSKEVVTEFGRGQFPDGMAFDAEGHVWIACIVSNQLLRIDPANGRSVLMLQDADEAHVGWFEEAYYANALNRPHMERIMSHKLRNTSSLAFTGAALDTILIGCLLGDHIYRVRSPVRGHPPVHWQYGDGVQ